ncbi:MAG: hypothetical protein IKL10_03800 [Clostridia bacterium]|nr:hypothetical protein [Clostridia bacterium]
MNDNSQFGVSEKKEGKNQFHKIQGLKPAKIGLETVFIVFKKFTIIAVSYLYICRGGVSPPEARENN